VLSAGTLGAPAMAFAEHLGLLLAFVEVTATAARLRREEAALAARAKAAQAAAAQAAAIAQAAEDAASVAAAQAASVIAAVPGGDVHRGDVPGGGVPGGDVPGGGVPGGDVPGGGVPGGVSVEQARKLALLRLELVKFVSDIGKAFHDCELSAYGGHEGVFICCGLFSAVLSTHKNMVKALRSLQPKPK